MSKFIRTEDGIYILEDFSKTENMRCLNHYGYRDKSGLGILGTLKDFKGYKQSDTIEELCDEFVFFDKDNKPHYKSQEGEIWWLGASLYTETLKGAIFTDKGLIYVAKMNEKGELVLI